MLMQKAMEARLGQHGAVMTTSEIRSQLGGGASAAGTSGGAQMRDRQPGASPNDEFRPSLG